MKISVNLNRIPLSYNIKDDFEKARLYLLKHNVDITFAFKDVSVKGYTPYWTGSRWLLSQTQNLVQLDPSADMDMFVFDQAEWANPKGSKFPLKPNTPNGNCFPMLGKPFINIGRFTSPDWQQIAHEIMHGIVEIAKCPDVMDTYRENNNPDSPTGNFAEQWVLLQPYLNKQIMYKYFSPKEVVKFKLKPELWTLLDKLREECGFPFIITSGLRSETENKALNGSVSDSAHLSGLAVDLSITDSLKRFKLIDISLKNGIKRIGVGKTFIHIDIDSSKPQNVCWLYD